MTGSGGGGSSPLSKRGARGDFQTRFAYRPDLKSKARTLRSRLTDAEQKLWFRLRRKQICGVQFYRQKPLGSYVVDFFAPSVRLVIELDGAQHQSARQKASDTIRDTWLRGQGLDVLRFDDRQVLQEIAQVLELIHAICVRRGNPSGEVSPKQTFSSSGISQ
ncbi:MAG: endonuclease domain-containing protein [Methylocella sp.]